ncbi:MAG: monothiol glutaredoxin [Rickettsiales bacterium]|jgi:monothiol glutaredoxin
MSSIDQEIEFLIGDNKVVLFMKGNKEFPQCGFSAAVCQILSTLEVDFMDIDVLKNPELRQGIKDFSDWPTVPQLYVSGEFIGGCDIIKEMYESGELQEVLAEKVEVSL